MAAQLNQGVDLYVAFLRLQRSFGGMSPPHLGCEAQPDCILSTLELNLARRFLFAIWA